MNKKKVKFIDLFAGIGGFHQALMQIEDIEAECVFASEIDKFAIDVYKSNYGIDSENDITKITGEEEILQDYNMMCAGFPCQAFSKAGNQEGFNDPTKGTLFFEMKKLLEKRIENKNPVKYIVFENVSNLVTHDKGNTFKTIYNTLTNLGYIMTEEPLVVSPHQVGVPQLRNRVFIVGIHREFYKGDKLVLDLNIPSRTIRNRTSMNCIKFDEDIKYDSYLVNSAENIVINAWDDFKQNVIGNNIIGFPIWVDYFKFDEADLEELPMWKQQIVQKNISLYKKNVYFIKKWMEKHNVGSFLKSHRKFEWQAGKDINSLDEGIMQFRPSGLRVKRPTEFPSLVAMVHTPIICVSGVRRRLTPREVARLQSFPEDFKISSLDRQAYKQFGNSVNVKVVKEIISELLRVECINK